MTATLAAGAPSSAVVDTAVGTRRRRHRRHQSRIKYSAHATNGNSVTTRRRLFHREKTSPSSSSSESLGAFRRPATTFSDAFLLPSTTVKAAALRSSVFRAAAIDAVGGTPDAGDASPSSSSSPPTSPIVQSAATSTSSEASASDSSTNARSESASEPATTSRASTSWWVRLLNTSLASDPGWTLAAFVLVDVGSALCLYVAFAAAAVPVDADFALAYALSKSIRAPRLALDAYVAAKMAGAVPDLAAVRVGLLLDAAGGAATRAKDAALGWISTTAAAAAAAEEEEEEEEEEAGGDGGGIHEGVIGEVAAGLNQRGSVERGIHDGGGGAAIGERDNGEENMRKKKKRRKLRVASSGEPGAAAKMAAEARTLTDKYGLAYMAAKNVIGPVSIAAFYVLLRCGVDVQGALNAAIGTKVGGGAGKTAGLLALASWTSTLLFPAVVLGAGVLGPRLGRLAVGATAAFAALVRSVGRLVGRSVH